MKTRAMIAEKLKNAETGAQHRRRRRRARRETGKPQYFTLAGRGEDLCRFRADRHQSRRAIRPRRARPTRSTSCRAALVQIGAYRFTPELSRPDRGYFDAAAPARDARDRRGDARASPRTRRTRRRSRRSPPIRPMSARSARPASRRWSRAGMRSTRCRSARPPTSTAASSPAYKPADGHGRAAAASRPIPRVKFSDVTEGSVPNDASPLRPDFDRGGREGDGRGLPRRADLPEHVVGRERLACGSAPRRAELRREPDLHQGVGRFQPRAERAHAGREHRARDNLLPVVAARSRQIASARGGRACPASSCRSRRRRGARAAGSAGSPMHAVDHAAALHRRARGDRVGPALDVLVVLHLQELAGVVEQRPWRARRTRARSPCRRWCSRRRRDTRSRPAGGRARRAGASPPSRSGRSHIRS